MTMTYQQLADKARETRIRIGNETKAKLRAVISEADVPLTINEINELLFRTYGKAMSRVHLRTVLQQLVESGEIKSRYESEAERLVQTQGARGRTSLVFARAAKIAVVRTKLPVQTRFKKQSKKRIAAPVAKKADIKSVHELIEDLVAQRTKALQARVNELEAKLSRITKLAK